MGKTVKIRKDDMVLVIAGKDRGKRGAVLRVLRDVDRVLVQGLNMRKKTIRRKSAQDEGGIMEVESPIHISNVMIMGKKGPTRVGYRMENGKKVRVCRKTGEVL